MFGSCFARAFYDLKTRPFFLLHTLGNPRCSSPFCCKTSVKFLHSFFYCCSYSIFKFHSFFPYLWYTMSVRDNKKTKILPAAAAKAPTPAAVANLAKIGKKPKAGPGDSVKDSNPRPISHQEVRRDKKRDRSRSSSAVRLPLEKKTREEANRPRSNTLTGAPYDPVADAVPLGPKLPSHITNSPPREVRSQSPAPSCSTIPTDDDGDTIVEQDTDDDLAGIKIALADMEVEARKQNFEKAMAAGDEQAAALAVTEEEMRRVREKFFQVRPDLFSSPYPCGSTRPISHRPLKI